LSLSLIALKVAIRFRRIWSLLLFSFKKNIVQPPNYILC